MSDVPRIGTEFAGYRIDALIGRGGMSVVYRAENPRLGNMVALKLLAPELASDETFRERFVRESRLAASINHPNIIPIYDAGAHDGLLYIAMRYVDGLDLKQLIRQRGALPAAQALSIIGQAARALDAAHRRGLVHRDVKPANILVEAADAGNEHAYLADFGLMKHPSSRSGLTATGQFMGTIDYVSPEQIEGKPVDARSDLYSLGCVLYEALSSRVPFVKDADVAVMFAHLNEAPPRLSELRRDLPAGIDAVIERSLAKAPEDRYATCQEMIDAARVALAGQPAPARPAETRIAPTPVADATRPARRPRPEHEDISTHTAPAPPSKSTAVGHLRNGGRSPLLLIAALAVLIAIGALTAVALTRSGSSTGAGSTGKSTGAGSDGSSTPSTSTHTTTTGTSTGWSDGANRLAQTFAYIPNTPAQCNETTSSETDGSLAEVHCQQTDGVETWFELWPDGTAMDRESTRWADSAGRFENDYWWSKSDPTQTRVGRFIRFDLQSGTYDGSTVIFFTYYGRLMSVYALRSDGDREALHSWWETQIATLQVPNGSA